MECSLYTLQVMYSGGQYNGWQVQKDKPSIAAVLQQAIKRIWSIKDAYVRGISRTDSGVHAYCQIACVTCPVIYKNDLDELCKILNNHLPSDICIKSALVCDDFEKLFTSVELKTYIYTLSAQKPTPWLAPYITHYPYPLNLNVFEKALQVLIGTHDFSSFVTDIQDKNPIRTVTECSVHYIEQTSYIRVVIKGQSFLRYMIRRMVGAALTCASRGYSINKIKEALEERNPYQSLLNAPSHGLMLLHIKHKEELFPLSVNPKTYLFY